MADSLIQFDTEAARADGVSDADIAAFLAPKVGFDLTAARRDGVSDSAIVDFLAPAAPATPVAAPESKKWNLGREVAAAGKGFARGVASLPGRVLLEQTGALASGAGVGLEGVRSKQEAMLRGQIDIMDRIDRGERIAPTDDPMGYADAPPDVRSSMRQDTINALAAPDTAIGRVAQSSKRVGGKYLEAGKETREFVERQIPMSRAEEESVGGLVGTLAAEVPAYIGAFATGGVPGVVAYSGMDAFNQTWQAAKEAGADDETAATAATLSGFVQGGLDAVPGVKMARVIPKALREQTFRTAREMVEGAGTMLGFSQLSMLVDNAIAKNSYDPDRDLKQGVLDPKTMAAQAIVGGLPAAAGGVARRVRKTPEEAVKPILDAPDTDAAIQAAREVVEGTPVDVDALARDAQSPAAEKQASLLKLFSGMNEGEVQSLPDGSYQFLTGTGDKAQSAPLKVWEPGAEPVEGGGPTVSPELVAAQRDAYGKLGIKVIYFENDPNIPFDGAVDPNQPDTIFLSNNPERNVFDVGGHEVGHVVESVIAPGGERFVDLLHGQVREFVTQDGLVHAGERFVSTAPDVASFPATPEGRAAHQDALVTHLLRELGADLHGEAPKFATYIPKVIEQIEVRYGADAAKGVLRDMIAGFREALERLRAFFVRSGEAPQAQHWVTNIEAILDTMAKMDAERYMTQVERERARLDAQRPGRQAPAPSPAPEAIPPEPPPAAVSALPESAVAAEAPAAPTVGAPRSPGPEPAAPYAGARDRAERMERWLGELDADRRAKAEASPQVQQLRATIETILGKVRGVESRLTKAAAERLRMLRERLDTLTNPEGDSPDMALVRKQLAAERQRMADAAAVGTGPAPATARAAIDTAPPVATPPPAAEPVRGRAVMPEPTPARPAGPAEIVATPPPVEAAPTISAAEPAAVAQAPVAAPAVDRSLVQHERLQAKAVETGLPTTEPPAGWQPAPTDLAQAKRVVKGWSPDVPERRPQSLLDFVRKNGGLRMDTPEAAEMLASDIGRQPGLLRRQGMQADQMAQAAADAGYRLGAETRYGSGVDVDAFVTALIEDASGRREHFPEGHDTDAYQTQQKFFQEFSNYLEDIGLKPKGMDARQVAWLLQQDPATARTLALLNRRASLGDDASLELAWRLDGERAKAQTETTPEPGAWEMADHRDLPPPTREELDRHYDDYRRSTGQDRPGERVAEAGRSAAEGTSAAGEPAGARRDGREPAQAVPGTGEGRDGLDPRFSPRRSELAQTTPLIETPEAPASELSARQRQVEKERAQLRMQGKARKAGQETADDLPLFGGERQGTLFAPKARDIQTGPDGRSQLFDDDVRRWRNNHQNFLAPGRTAEATVLRQNFVLQAMDGRRGAVAISPAVAQAIASKHRDIPASVWRDLPELLADPRFVYPHRDGGLNFVIDRSTARGEPIIIGVRDGTIHTITPINDTADSTGNERLAGFMLSNVKSGKRVYAETAAFLSQLSALREEQWTFPNAEVRVPRTSDEQSGGRLPSNVLTRADVIKGQGRILYSPKITGENPNRKYTAAENKAFANVGRATESRGLVDWIGENKEGLGKKFVANALDPYRPILEYGPQAYIAARNANSSTASMNAFVTEGTLKFDGDAYNLAKRNGGVEGYLVRPLGDEAHDFLWWVAANRAERLKAEDRENLFSADDIAALKRLNRGQLAFDYKLSNGKTTRSREAAYMDSLKKLDEINRSVMELDVESGLVGRDQADVLLANPYYVNFRRVAEDIGNTSFAGATTSGLTKQYAFKKLKGGTEKLNSDLWQNMFGTWEHQIDAAIKNRAARRVLDVATKAQAARRLTAQEALHLSDKALKDQTVWVMEDGKKTYYAVEDPMLLRAISALNRSDLWGGPVMTGFRGFKRLLTIGVTTNPAFIVRNFIRANLHDVGIAPLSPNLIKNIATGFRNNDIGGDLANVARAVAGQELNPRQISDAAASAMAGGGLMNFSIATDTGVQKMQLSTLLDSESAIGKLWDYIGKTANAYRAVGGQAEQFNRIALYEKLRKEGVPHDAASFAARDIMDFTLRGPAATVRFLTDTVPFMNAWLQGLYKSGRALSNADKDLPVAAPGKKPASTTARAAYLLGAITIGLLALDAFYADDPDYQKREEYDRNANIWFKIGDTQFSIPMGFELAAMARIAANGAEVFFDENMTGERFAKNLLTIVGTNMNMNPTPQAVKPIIELATNESRTGRPIENRGMERLRSEERFTINNTLAARGASAALNAAARAIGGQHAEALSPVQIDYLVQAYGGWLGTMALSVVDNAIRPFTSEPDRPERDTVATITQGMIRTTPSPQSRYVSMLYEQSKGIERAYATYRDMVRQGRTDEAREFLEDNRDLIRRRGLVNRVVRMEGDLNQRIRLITNSPDPSMTPERKRLLIQQLQAQKNRIAEQAMRVSR